MNLSTPQPEMSKMEPNKSWFLRHKFFGLVSLSLVVVLTIGGVYFYQLKNALCGDRYDPYQNLQTGETKLFNLCEKIPLGWQEWTPPQDLKSDWKIYTNDQYGFEFRYPAYFAEQEITWQSKDALAMLVDTKEFSDYSGFIKVGIADGKIDKSEFNSTGYLTNPDLILYNKKNNIKFPAPVEEIINSIRWYKFIEEETGDCFGSFYQVEHNNKIIELAFTACEYYPRAFLNRDFKLQNQILSTFRFTR